MNKDINTINNNWLRWMRIWTQWITIIIMNKDINTMIPMNEDGNTMNINDYNEWGYKNNKYISMIIM